MSNLMKSLNSAKELAKLLGSVISKHSSDLYFAASIVSGAATVVSACKATLDIQPAVEEFKACVNDINEHAEEELERSETQQEIDDIREYKVKALREEKKKLAVTVVKSYARTVAYAATTICLAKCGVNVKNQQIRVLKDENAAISSALMSKISDFNKYRERVVKIRARKKTKSIFMASTQSKKRLKRQLKMEGQRRSKETRKVLNDNLPSLTRCISEESCGLMATAYIPEDDELTPISQWEYKGNQYLLMALKNVEKFIKDYIKQNGGITVEKIDQLLRMDIQLNRPEAEFNRNAGYIYDPEKPFSFNMYDIQDPDKRNFFNGIEHRIYIEIPINSLNVCRDLRKLSEEKSRRRRGAVA